MTVILPSVYKDGTATVAAGGIAVTGQSTLFMNSVLPGDFFGVHKGMPIRIASVESNTALTLANPWPGAAQTAAAFEIMLQSDMARVQESTRQLLVMLLGGNIDAFAGLSGADKKVPYFTGAGTMTLADFTNLLAFANLTGAADRMAYFTGAGALALSDIKAAGRTFLGANFTPVQQSGGAGQTTNKVYIGWDGVSKLKAQVDASDLGGIWTDAYAQQSNSLNGYQKFPSGFILQWGQIAANTVSDVPVTFPISFPSALRGASVTPIGYGALTNVTYAASYDLPANSGFAIRRTVISAGGGLSYPNPSFAVAWMAWGY
ncbi:hypothetical protein LJR235_002868 [Pararhizobium sp. LjRoot235]|uniref:gp53-like domain-containing protein n=1 Tax=Pararhizobium sp. LjRoot235 TaxID=3342291 RepID=UPI003ECDD62B